MIELRNITKRFGDVLANDHVNIKVEPGTIHAIVGENGAGKSTAMRIAYGFYTADSGEILVDGQVREINSPHDAIALGIGMVHQHFMLVETDDRGREHRAGRRAGHAVALDLRPRQRADSQALRGIQARRRSARAHRESFGRPAAAGRAC